jgi:hypothetical protein
VYDATQISSSTEVAVDTEGLVFARGGPGAWDSAAVGNPVVRQTAGNAAAAPVAQLAPTA